MLKYICFFVVLQLIYCEEECNLRAIFKTPKDYDDLGILERSNFEDETTKKNDNPESPKSFANAQILLKIGDQRQNMKKFMESQQLSPYNMPMPLNYMFSPFNPYMPYMMPFMPFGMPPFGGHMMPKDNKVTKEAFGDILKEKIDDVEAEEPLKVTKFEGFVKNVKDGDKDLCEGVKNKSEDDETIILPGKNIEVLKDTAEEGKITKIHNIEHPKILPEVTMTNDEISRDTTEKDDEITIETEEETVVGDDGSPKQKDISQSLHESLAKVVSSDVNFIPKLVVTYPVVKFELSPKNISFGDLPIEKLIKIHDEDDLFRFKTPILVQVSKDCDCPCCKGIIPSQFKHDFDSLTTFKNPEHKTIILCSKPPDKNENTYGLLQKGICERFEVIPKYDIIPLTKETTKTATEATEHEKSTTTTEKPNPKHPPQCTCSECCGCKRKYTGELNSLF